MRNKLVKSLLAGTLTLALAVGVSACQINTEITKSNLSAPKYVQIVQDYQQIVGANTQQYRESQKAAMAQMQQLIPTGLLPEPLWAYLQTHTIAPIQVEMIWPKVVALKKTTAKFPGFSANDVQKLIDLQLRQNKAEPQKFTDNTIDLMRLVLFAQLAQQAKLSEQQIQAVAEALKTDDSKLKLQYGQLDNNSTQMLGYLTRGQLQVPVLVPNVSKGVMLQGYDNARKQLQGKLEGTAQ